jgi:hypothetical protein
MTPEPMMRCSISVRVDSTLKGSLREGGELTFLLGLVDFPDFYEKAIGRPFLQYHDSLMSSNIGIRPPCYGFEHGFFVLDGNITSREVALGHSLSLDSLAKLAGATSIKGGKGRAGKPRGRRAGAKSPDYDRHEVSSSGRRLPDPDSPGRASGIGFPYAP